MSSFRIKKQLYSDATGMPLTKIESDYIKIMLSGCSTFEEIAERRQVTNSAVSAAMSNIYLKTGAKNMTDLVLMIAGYKPCPSNLSHLHTSTGMSEIGTPDRVPMPISGNIGKHILQVLSTGPHKLGPLAMSVYRSDGSHERSAIMVAICRLRKAGYNIVNDRRIGYRLLVAEELDSVTKGR